MLERGRRSKPLFLCIALAATASVTSILLPGCIRKPVPVETASAPVPPVAPPQAAPEPTPAQRRKFEATAYSITGTTKSGLQTRRGIVAADPAILPIGSRIRLHGIDRYSGEYLVADTGRAIDGHEIDIYMPNRREAKRFGRRQVQVEILQLGEGKADRRLSQAD